MNRIRRVLPLIALACLSLFFALPASAAKIDDQFRAWLANDLWPEAKANGISRRRLPG
jgi:membrane-bound lytic murein transglycosylase B